MKIILHSTIFTKECQTVTTDVIAESAGLEESVRFDIIFMDPPYRQGAEEDVVVTRRWIFMFSTIVF